MRITERLLFIAIVIFSIKLPLKAESSFPYDITHNISEENKDAIQNTTNRTSYFYIDRETFYDQKHHIGSKHYRKITPIMFMNPTDNESYCSSLEDFPNFFTPEQRKNGAIIVAFLVGIYCFTLLAIICDRYFLPCVETICDFLHLSQDVAAATFMAMATSAPELFVNIIGTFITESDIGIGTVVGSSMFNTLGVAALGGLTAKSAIKVDWWPVTRDCTLYMMAITLLVMMTWDGLIYWYEGLVLFIVYFLYFIVMFNNDRISRVFKSCITNKILEPKVSSAELTCNDANVEISKNIKDISTTPPIFFIEDPLKTYSEFRSTERIITDKPQDHSLIMYSEPIEKIPIDNDSEEFTEYNNKKKEKSKLCTMPNGGFLSKAFYVYTWPIRILLHFTIPNSKKNPKLFPITFIMCILFIGGNSYVISWMITIIGHTFGISESVLGLTLLAAGGCLPEAISIVIMSRKGEGSMGVSNALGANTMNILLSLGLPWFIKTMLTDNLEGSFIEITSGSIEYTILGLILVAAALFITLYFNKFYLHRQTGIILGVVYLIFLSMAIVSEILFVESESC